MSFQKDCSDHQLHSKNLSLHKTSNVEDIPLFKIKRSRSHENLTITKPFKDSKKKVSNSAQNQDGKVLKENKSKSNTNFNVCYCAPATHEGSFKCRFHRVRATEKSVCEESIYVRCSKFEQKYKKPLSSRLGRVNSAEEFGSQFTSTHEGSFKCRLHRVRATEKSVCEESSYVRCNKFEQKYKKLQLSRFWITA